MSDSLDTKDLPRSKSDKQLDAVLELKKISARMKDVSSELTTFLSHFSDRSKLLRNQKSALLSLEKTIIPFITKVASEIHSTSTDLAPVGGANYIHSLEEKKSKKVSTSNTKRK